MCNMAGLSSGRWTTALMEGTARMMQDQIYTDLDADGGRMMGASFEAKSQIIWSTLTAICSQIAANYDAALWWKYVGEQFASTPLNPTWVPTF